MKIAANTFEPDENRRARRIAGKALMGFIFLMVLLTWFNGILNDMTIATVVAATVQRGQLDKQLSASGNLKSAQSLVFVEDHSARVVEAPFAQGENVSVGDVLYVLDYTDVEANLRKTLESAQNDTADKRRALNRAQEGLSRSALSKVNARIKALEEAQAIPDNREQIEAAEAALAADSSLNDYIDKDLALKRAEKAEAEALAAYEKAIAGVEKTPEGYEKTVFASVDGQVMSTTLKEGGMVSVNEPPLSLSDISGGLILDISVNSEQAENWAVGDTATLDVGEKRYNGGIVSITPDADNAQNVMLRFLLPKDAGSVGAKADMRLSKRTQSYDILIPLSALHSDSYGDFVYVIEQKEGALGAQRTIRRVDVYVLDKDANRAALQSGVSGRDSLMARSDRAVSDGDRVRVEGE